jgi:hypothetical protein
LISSGVTSTILGNLNDGISRASCIFDLMKFFIAIFIINTCKKD